MVLTNLGVAVAGKWNIKESCKIGIAQREGKAKFLKAWKCGSTRLAHD